MPSLSYDTSTLAILVVDDDPIMLRMLEATLRTDRHTVGVASDTTEALELFQSRAWDVVLTDLNMPGRSGEALAQEVKRLAPTTAVILMSGFAAGTSSFAGVDELIQKPFRRAGIASAINRSLKANSGDAS